MKTASLKVRRDVRLRLDGQWLRHGMKHYPALKVAVIGLSRAPELLDEIRKTPVTIVGVADFDLQSEAVRNARHLGIHVTHDYTELLERSDLDLVVNLVPDSTVQAIIQQLKPDRARVLQGSTATLLVELCRQLLFKRSLLDLLRETARLYSPDRDTHTALMQILQRIAVLLDAQAVGMWARQDDILRFVNGFGMPKPLERFEPPIARPTPLGGVFSMRGPLWVPEIHSEPGFEVQTPLVEAGLRSMLVLPLNKDYEIAGCLALFFEDPASYDRELLPMLTVVAEVLVPALEVGGARQGSRDYLIRDEATGLYNDVYFTDRLKAELQRAGRKELPCSLLYLNVAVDARPVKGEAAVLRPYLKTLAAQLLEGLRVLDVPARYRNNDFAVILPDTSVANALKAAERLLGRLYPLRLGELVEHGVKISIGIAAYPEHATRRKELLDNAELAAFLASREDGNRIRLFPSGRMELEGLSPDKIVRQYPMLAEILEALLSQGHETYRHAQGTAYYASLTGRELGLSQQKIQELALAGWLHDIGKLTVPEMRGKLPKKLSQLPDISDRVHSAVGAYILKNIINLPGMLKGVRYHHADYDGKGEPSGLAGDSIPLSARIIAAADAYQKLRQKKEGDPSFSRNELFLQLREMAGHRLDPEVVESLIRATAAE